MALNAFVKIRDFKTVKMDLEYKNIISAQNINIYCQNIQIGN